MDVAIMIEAQDGLTWPRWQRIVSAVEELGFAGLYRSDHFTNADPPDKESLELWVSLTWAAANSKRIEFGPLVTPASFRHPVFTARIGKDVDDLSGGRLTLGVGAGWQVAEHDHFGFDLLDMDARFARFAESLEVIHGLLHSAEPLDFSGKYYTLRQALLLPRAQRPGGPPLLIGGNGPQRTLPLVARFADEWNGVYLTADRFAELSGKLDALLVANGRSPASLRRSLMVGLVYGRSDAELVDKLRGRPAQPLLERGVIVGTDSAVAEQLARLAGVGVQRVMLQWLDMDDLDGLEALAHAVL